jgi:hypothetical protein
LNAATFPRSSPGPAGAAGPNVAGAGGCVVDRVLGDTGQDHANIRRAGRCRASFNVSIGRPAALFVVLAHGRPFLIGTDDGR